MSCEPLVGQRFDDCRLDERTEYIGCVPREDAGVAVNASMTVWIVTPNGTYRTSRQTVPAGYQGVSAPQCPRG